MPGAAAFPCFFSPFYILRLLFHLTTRFCSSPAALRPSFWPCPLHPTLSVCIHITVPLHSAAYASTFLHPLASPCISLHPVTLTHAQHTPPCIHDPVLCQQGSLRLTSLLPPIHLTQHLPSTVCNCPLPYPASPNERVFVFFHFRRSPFHAAPPTRSHCTIVLYLPPLWRRLPGCAPVGLLLHPPCPVHPPTLHLASSPYLPCPLPTLCGRHAGSARDAFLPKPAPPTPPCELCAHACCPDRIAPPLCFAQPGETQFVLVPGPLLTTCMPKFLAPPQCRRRPESVAAVACQGDGNSPPRNFGALILSQRPPLSLQYWGGPRPPILHACPGSLFASPVCNICIALFSSK